MASALATHDRPPMSMVGILNMCFGFFGIQFGWGLQMANMSSIYDRLGAKESDIPLLWLAAPLTGFIVQPIVGYYSDRTWGRLGRRRPYFIGGTLVAAIALFLMPSSHELWMAASLLWMLDAAVNVSMEPFRAFVGDLLPEKQRKVGYAMQSVLIGAGAVISSALPWILKQFGVSDAAAPGTIPDTVRYAFISGAIVYVLAVTYTVVTTREYPPENMDELRREQARARNPFAAFVDIVKGVGSMPRTMIELAFVQFFTWIALFLMWIYFGVGVAKHIFNAPTGTPEYEQASAWAGVCFSVYNGVAFVFAFALLGLTRVFSAKAIHTVCLLLGALGLASYGLSMLGVPFSKNALLIPMVGVGIAWASILSMPYAMLSSALPREKMGFYMGVFNFFIVLPQILAAVAFGPLMKAALNDNALSAIVIGGGCMALAAVATLFVKERPATQAS
ncbi:MAG: MFS transporter [Planctomycetota bacterium]|nr:MFS transporter [Planctomycetota bacterium]